jgi:hypothetical protein
VAALNNRDAIFFDGSDDHFMTNTFTELAQPNTIFVVADGVNKGAGRNILDGDVGTGKRNAIYWEGSNGKIRMYAGGSEIELNNVEAEPWTTPLILNAEFNGNYSVIRRGGNALTSAGNPGTNGPTKFAIGTYNGSGGSWTDYIAEIIVYNRLLSIAEQNTVGQYLATKYGLSWSNIPAVDLAYLPYSLMTDGLAAATSVRTAISASCVTANTEGTKVELDPSLSSNCSGVIMTFRTATGVSGTNGAARVSLYTGGSGSEVLWATVEIGNNIIGHQLFIPGSWPAGTRLSFSLKSAVSRTLTVVPNYITEDVQYFSTSPAELMGLTTNNATSRGEALATPAAVNTKGAWTQITASTTNALKALVVGMDSTDTTITACNMLVDVGIGGAGAETVLIPDITLLWSSTEQVTWVTPQTYLVDVPAGSRLSMRYAASNITNSPIDGSLTGIR